MMLSIKKKSTVLSPLPPVSEGTLAFENAAKTLKRKKAKVLKLIRTTDRLLAYNSVKVQERSGSLFVSNFLPFLALNEPDGNVKSRRFTMSSMSRKLKSPNGEATA